MSKWKKYGIVSLVMIAIILGFFGYFKLSIKKKK